MVLDVELAQRAFAEVLGNGGDSVALLDGKTGNRQIRVILADQRDIGAVQGGHKGKDLPLGARRQHLPGQQGAYRVRDGVMHMQEMEFVNLRHFRHSGG